jgi:membrane-associated phospholipid phosphatase
MTLRTFSRRRTVLLWRILVGLIFILIAFTLDDVVQATVQPTSKNRSAETLADGWEKNAAHILSRFGDWPYLLLAGGVALGITFLLRRYRASRIVALILIAGMLTGFTCTIIRSTVGRTRPLSHHAQGFYGPWFDSHWIMGKYEFGAFPSGHTATAMGLAAAVWMFNRRLGVLCGLVAVAIAWSRIVLGCHHFSDVVAATVWAFLVAPAFVLLLDPWSCRLWRKWFGHWKNPSSLTEDSPLSPPLVASKKLGLS